MYLDSCAYTILFRLSEVYICIYTWICASTKLHNAWQLARLYVCQICIFADLHICYAPPRDHAAKAPASKAAPLRAATPKAAAATSTASSSRAAEPAGSQRPFPRRVAPPPPSPRGNLAPPRPKAVSLVRLPIKKRIRAEAHVLVFACVRALMICGGCGCGHLVNCGHLVSCGHLYRQRLRAFVKPAADDICI